MKKKEPGDVILTFKVNLTAISRAEGTPKSAGFIHAQGLLQRELRYLRDNPSVVDRRVFVDDTEVGEIKLDW